MRCSVCLGEMKEGPDGLYCEACATVLEPLRDGEEPVITEVEPRLDNKLIVGIAGGLLALALIVAGSFAWMTSGSGGQNLWGEGDAISLGQAFVASDSNQIVGDIVRMSAPDDRIQLIRDKGCQSVGESDLSTIHWVNMTGESLSLLNPEIPGNWRIGQACPTETNGAYLLTHLNDGLAISEIGNGGDLQWTQLLNAKSDREDAIAFEAFGDTVLVTSQGGQDGRVQIVSYGPGGAENWKQTIVAASEIERPTIVRNSFDDFLVAWQETDGTVRLLIISVTGIIVQDSRIQDHNAALRGVIDDDLGRTLLVGGNDFAYAELVSATGEVEWRRTVSATARPIGVARSRENFLVFAVAGNTLFVWGINEDGTRSNTVELETAAPLTTGQVRQTNATEAIITLQTDAGAPVDLTLNLRRIANGLSFDVTSDLSAELPIAARDLPVEIEPQTIATVSEPVADRGPELSVATPAETVRSDPAPVAASSFEPEIETVVETSEPELPDVTPEPAQPEPVVEAPAQSTTPARDPDPEPVSEAPRPVQTAETDGQARCTFTCVSLDEPIIEYLLMQTVDVTAGESMTDVELRLNKSHETLCSVSSGQPDETFTRECVAP